MRKSWRIYAVILLGAVWPQFGCVQTPGDKSVQDLRPIQQKVTSAKKQELTAADITQTWLAQAEQLRKENKLNEAIVLCEKMREPGSPHTWQATRKLAFLYDQSQDLDRAMDEYKRLLQQYPKDADILAKIGDMYTRRGKWEAAEKWYSDALFHQPNHVSARSGLGFALAQQKDWDRSLKEYMKIPVPEAEAYCAIAFVMKLKGLRQDAARAYDQALKIDPGLERARTGLKQMQQSLVTDQPRVPNLELMRAGEKGVVQLEDAPPSPIQDTSRLMMQRPTLPPLPEINLPK